MNKIFFTNIGVMLQPFVMIWLYYALCVESGQCPSDQWFPISPTVCLVISTDVGPELRTWDEAREVCQVWEPMSSLASFPTDDNLETVAEKLKLHTSYWVGFRTQMSNSSQVKWLDGSKVNQSVFVIVSNHSLDADLCCHVTINQLYPVLNVTWSLDDCDTRLPFICLLHSFNGVKALLDPPFVYRAFSETLRFNNSGNRKSSSAAGLKVNRRRPLTARSEWTQSRLDPPSFNLTSSLSRSPQNEIHTTDQTKRTKVSKDNFVPLKDQDEFPEGNAKRSEIKAKRSEIKVFVKLKDGLNNEKGQGQNRQGYAVNRKGLSRDSEDRGVNVKGHGESTEDLKTSKQDSVAVDENTSRAKGESDETVNEGTAERRRRSSECQHWVKGNGNSCHCCEQHSGNCEHQSSCNHSLAATHSSPTESSSLTPSSHPHSTTATSAPTSEKTSSTTPAPRVTTYTRTRQTTATTKRAQPSTTAATATAVLTTPAQRLSPLSSSSTNNPRVVFDPGTSPGQSSTLDVTDAGVANSVMVSSQPPELSLADQILNKLNCNTSSLVDCLVSNVTLYSEPEMYNQNLMTSFYEMLDELTEMIGKGAVTKLVEDLQEYAKILNVNLRFCLPLDSLCSEQRKHDLLEKVDLFMDNVITSESDNPDFKEFSFTLDQLDMFMVKSVYGAIRGRTLQMKSGEITIEDISPSRQFNNSARIFVSAMIMHLPRSNVQLAMEGQTGLVDAAVVSPVLSLKAYVERSKVNVIHNFSLLARSYENDTNIHVCGFQSNNGSSVDDIWDTQGCSVITEGATTTGAGAGFNGLLPLDDKPPGGNHSGSNRNRSSHGGTSSGSRTDRIVGCHCNHTTNFAILMQIVDFQMKEVDELALSIITYIGCSVTLITQVMAITVFTCIRSLNSERVCVHRNLCITIMLAQVTFIAGVQAVDDKVVCAVVAVALHYLYTATFVWMLVEGLHLYSQVVRVFGTEKSRIVYYIVFGWGVPLVLVAISAAVDWDGYGNSRSCWLSIQRSTIWAFVGPAVAIIIVNLVILLLVLRIVISSAKLDKQDSFRNVRAGIKASLFLAPLLGLTWIFGLASVNEHFVAFQYIFAILNSLQGFFIFLFHCALNTEVRQAIARLREKRSLQKGDFGTSSTNSRPSSSDSRSISSGGNTVSERWSSVTKSRNRIMPSPLCKDKLSDALSTDDHLKFSPMTWKTNLI